MAIEWWGTVNLPPSSLGRAMIRAITGQHEQSRGGLVEAVAHLRRELSPLVCRTHVLKSGAHRRPLGLIQSWPC